ncbi:DUF11 domain-containing protein [Deinococcus roseus]|uniref:DUF11 domain-containing protein n=1 Tax=Deinococcus roseus TaxID=392414 RepID=A0ABQ2CY99_9DEIO|nr:DUF11 domain-containing protein [Deinococcus roseus]GGJ26132.1 hypothetical protein GCM10008938_10360 [Deinococcus roseus]
MSKLLKLLKPLKPLKPLLIGLGLLSLWSCGTYTSPPPLPGGKVVRLEISPAALLLTAKGQKQQLKVRALDAQGKTLSTPATRINWVSSRPEQVGISAAGEVSAATALGATQITAQVDGVTSAPVLVSVAEPQAGVTLLNDSQISGSPNAVDETAEGDLDNQYEVTLKGIPEPKVGSLLLGREGLAVGGEVVSSQKTAEGFKVRLKLVPLKTLMKTAKIDEVISYQNLQPDFPKEILQLYNIQEVDGAFQFTPKPGATVQQAQKLGLLKQAASGTFVLPPFNECETTLPALPISLGQLPSMTAKVEPTFELKYDTQDNLQKFIVRAEPSFKIQINLVVNVDALVALECKSTLYSKLLKLPGWAGLILAGEVEAGVAFELEGRLTLAKVGVELSSESKAKLEMGIVCTAGDCQLLKKIEPSSTNKVNWVVPSIGQIRLEPSLFGYGFVGLKAGATLIKSLRADAVKAKMGGKYEASLAPAAIQTVPQDPDYKSSYKLSLLSEIGAGKKINGFLNKLGIVKMNTLKLTFSTPLGASPKGRVTFDKKTFEKDDKVSFRVSMDPTSVNFPGVGYNLKKVKILRRVLGNVIQVPIIEQVASKDQTEFTLLWTADQGSASAGSEFYAFMETQLPSIFDLEIGQAELQGTPFEVLPSANAGAVNDLGQVMLDTGIFKDGNLIPYPENFSPTTLFLGTPLSHILNNQGQVAGTLLVPTGNTVKSHNAFWPDEKGQVVDLGFSIADREVIENTATSINNTGTVVAWEVYNKRPQDPAVFDMGVKWEKGVLSQIPRLSDSFVIPVVVNDAGLMALKFFDTSVDRNSVRLSDGRVVGLLGGQDTTAVDLNNKGQLVGYATNETGQKDTAFVWGNGIFTNLESLMPDPSQSLGSRALAINEAGDVVGQLKTATGTHAVMWSKGNFVDLTTLLDPGLNIHLSTARDINNVGQVLVTGKQGDFQKSFLLRPASNSADLALTLTAPSKATPLQNLTYAVNLQNLSSSSAQNILAEFTLPEGFKLVGTTGWSACNQVQSTVLCLAPELKKEEQKAFLVDVKAPEATGTFTLKAEVSSSTPDPVLTNNQTTGTTTIE